MSERYIPLDVRRQLRKESFFGCAKCGSPIIEYHHILPFAETPHHNPEEMIALCPTCHRSLGKMRRERCYELKRNPYNSVNGRIKGELSDKNISAFMVGSCTYYDTPVIFSFFGAPIIRFRVDDGQLLLSAYIPQESMWPDILIEDNDITINTDQKWDIDFRTNYLHVRKSETSTYFKIDLRREIAEIEGSIKILDATYDFTPEQTNLGGLMIRGGVFRNCGAGISVGDGRRKLVWPNFAMSSPRAMFVPI